MTETPRRIALVGCVKTKRRGTHPARDLYASPLFIKRRAYVESAGMPWYILSAEHGLLDPTTPIATYDKTLNDLSAADRRAWGQRVLVQLREQVGDMHGVTFEMHAGARYLAAIEAGMREEGAAIDNPLAHKGLGHQLAWYGRKPPAGASDD